MVAGDPWSPFDQSSGIEEVSLWGEKISSKEDQLGKEVYIIFRAEIKVYQASKRDKEDDKLLVSNLTKMPEDWECNKNIWHVKGVNYLGLISLEYHHTVERNLMIKNSKSSS